MIEECQMQLQTESILNVPLQIYGDFTFVVNGKEFKTSRLISDLLSPKICQIHKTDPTFNKYELKTNYEGDFSYVLNLTGFNQIKIPSREIPFICEAIEILENRSIKIKDSKNIITAENVFSLIHIHEQYSVFYAKSLEEEIDYISEHFYEIVENHEKELKELNELTIKKILMNPKLKAIDEDQILTFVNQLYSSDSKYSILYEYVSFENVEGESIDQFLEIFNINHLTDGTWKSLSKRLRQRNVNIKSKSDQNYFQNKQQLHQPQYQPIQPYQLQQLEQQLMQQYEEKLRQQQEDQLSQQEPQHLQQEIYQQDQENENKQINQQQVDLQNQQENTEPQQFLSNQNDHERKIFLYDSNNQFSGIIDYLEKESRGNIENILTVTASSISGRSFPLNVTYLFDKNKRYCSTGDEQNPWICFDFRDYKIIPSEYTLRSGDSGYNPKSWVIEGSNDNSNWQILDKQEDCSFLNRDFNIHTFSIPSSNSQQFRFLRMKLTGTNWKDNNLFIITSFEFYGTLI